MGVFDDLGATPEEIRAGLELETATNPRNAVAMGRLKRLPEEGIVTGQGASIVMAAFIHCSDSGGRFNRSDLGAWYAAIDIDTAIAETVYHNERRLRMSEGGFPNRIQMRELISDIEVEAVDVRGLQDDRPDLYHPTDYSQSQAWADSVRWPTGEGALAVTYHSLRNSSGENICVFHPCSVQCPTTQGAHFQYTWNEEGEVHVAELSAR